MKTPIDIVRYRTARECIAAFYGCRPSEIPFKEKHEFYDEKGVRRRQTGKSCYKSILAIGCWGWCMDYKVLHLWISRRASFQDAMALIAHELGHCQKPHFKSKGAEERKAVKYEDVTQLAAVVWTCLQRGRKT